MENTMRERQRAKGPATILAIGTASPENCVYQADMPDFYFRVTNTEHLTELKDKFKRICEKSRIKKRYFFLNEEILRENPKMCNYKAPSLDARQAMLVEEVPKLGAVAAEKAIKEWGRPISEISHLVFYTTSGLDMPGADLRLARLLGLGPAVTRLMLYNNGCYAGGAILRIAKDLAENNAGARILAVCVENMAVSFHAPSPDHLDLLLGQALFGDGAAALIIGSDPESPTERPLFSIAAASQRTIPGSEDAIRGRFHEMGLSYYLSDKVPAFVSESARECVVGAFASVGMSVEGCLNSLFYAVHPGGPAILDRIEEKLGLERDKLGATRRVLSEYGNMWSPCVLFVLDELRKKSAEEGASTTGEGSEWGVVMGFGPGLTVETVVLRSVKTLHNSG